MTHQAQRVFDAKYITSSEITETLNISRSTILHARRSGKLPEPILIKGQIYIWERSSVESYLNAWQQVLTARRGAHA